MGDDTCKAQYAVNEVYLIDPYWEAKGEGDDYRKIIILKVYPNADAVEIRSLEGYGRSDEIISCRKLDNMVVGRIGVMKTKGLFFKSKVFVPD